MDVTEFLDNVFGFSLKFEQLGYGHMAARAALIYRLLILVLRSAKKRFLRLTSGTPSHRSNEIVRKAGN
jgi:hypothetical protein